MSYYRGLGYTPRCDGKCSNGCPNNGGCGCTPLGPGAPQIVGYGDIVMFSHVERQSMLQSESQKARDRSRENYGPPTMYPRRYH